MDDDIRYLRLIEAFIDGFIDDRMHVSYAESAEQALAEIRKRPFHLIFTDFTMGSMDGIELARIARSLSPEITVILVTGSHMSAENTYKALEAGTSMIIAKPINLSILKKIIKNEQESYSAAFLMKRWVQPCHRQLRDYKDEQG